jgi:hypothetical protein
MAATCRHPTSKRLRRRKNNTFAKRRLILPGPIVVGGRQRLNRPVVVCIVCGKTIAFILLAHSFQPDLPAILPIHSQSGLRRGRRAAIGYLGPTPASRVCRPFVRANAHAYVLGFCHHTVLSITGSLPGSLTAVVANACG